MSVVSDVSTTPGWYGKLPTLGDFASRRLESDFIEPWDVWLGESLQAQRESMGEAWLDAYLQSPPWRFVLMPGVLPGFDPSCVLAGVLMPSVDRVGRYFPLTIAAAMAHEPRTALEYEALLAWLHRLEDVALDALHDDWSIDELEEALVILAPPVQPSAASSDPLAEVRGAFEDALASDGAFISIEAVAGRAQLAAVLAGSADGASIESSPRRMGTAFWLADNAEHPQLLVSKGLPVAADFVRMFGTSGRQPGTETIY